MSEYIAEVVQNQYGEATILKEKLIRCKDCSSRGMKNNYECYCQLLERWVSVNFYCGYGTREEE